MKKSRRLCILFLSVVFVAALCAACAKAADNAPYTQEPGSGQSGAAGSMSDTEENSNGDGMAEEESTVTESGQPESQKQGGTAENEAPAQKASTEAESAKQETSVQEDKSDIGTMQSEQEQQSSGSDSTPGTGSTPYSQHGKLSVNGTTLTDEHGAVFQLQGVSTHGIGWFPQYVNEDTFAELESWGVNAVRLAMYTAEGGYCEGGDADKDKLKKLIDTGVQAATKLGMYVIIDWHVLNDHDPWTYADEAEKFFAEMSEKYKDYGNVIYEICNEPNSGPDWGSVKSYAEKIIPVIRENAPDAVIIVGTPTWSQDVDKAAADPITGYDNIMYALHFYADTHRDYLRDRMKKAVDGGLPVIVSEFGICDASGNGGNNYDEGNKWIEVMDDYNISYFIWNLSNKAETSALISSSCSKLSGFADSELSDSGRWYKEVLIKQREDK